MRRGFVALLVALALGGAGCDVNQTTPQGDPSHDPNIQQTDQRSWAAMLDLFDETLGPVRAA